MHPVGVGETLCQALTKLVMRAAGDQAKTAGGNLQLCAGLEAGIEGATHTVGQRRLDRVKARLEEGEEEADAEVEEEEERSGGVAVILNNLTIETAGTEAEAAEGLAEALRMEVEEEGASKGEEEGGGNLRALEALEFLTQESACNGLNKLSRLEMLWTMRHRWPAGARFAFNCYNHWAQLLLRQPGELPVTILSKEEVTQGDPSIWFCTGSPSSPFKGSSEQQIRGSSPLSMPMMCHLMVWCDALHSY